MLRKLLNERSTKVERAQAIFNAADAEGRDLNEAERAEITQLLGEGDSTGEIGALDAQIEKISDERERFRAMAEKKFTPVDTSPQKPDGKAATSMKRSEFNKLSQAEQAVFIKNNGKVED